MATHYVWSGASGAANGDSWTDAYASIEACLTGEAIGDNDIIMVHKTHSFLKGSQLAWTIPETNRFSLQILCVDKDASNALATGAVEGVSGAFNFIISVPSGGATTLDINTVYMFGMTLQNGSGSGNGDIYISADTSRGVRFILDACKFYLNGTSASKYAYFGTSGVFGQLISFLNCEFQFGATSQSIAFGGGGLEFVNCKLLGSTYPSTAIVCGVTPRGGITCSGCDWSGSTNVFNQAADGRVDFRASNCVIATPVTGSSYGPGCVVSEFQVCSAANEEGASTGPNLLSYYYEDGCGIVEDSLSVYPTSSPAQGKQDDGTLTSYSLKMTPSALAVANTPLYTPWFATFVGSTGSKTFTVRVADTEAALLKNTELWLEVEYVGGAQTADSPQSQREGTFPLVSGTISRDILATASDLTDSAEAWTGITETGTYSLAKTVTVDEQGYVRCRVALAKDTTNPVYVDPKITVS